MSCSPAVASLSLPRNLSAAGTAPGSWRKTNRLPKQMGELVVAEIVGVLGQAAGASEQLWIRSATQPSIEPRQHHHHHHRSERGQAAQPAGRCSVY